MVLCLKTKKEETQQARKYMAKNGWYDEKYQLGKSGKYILIPINENANQKKIVSKFKGTIEKRNLQKITKKTNSLRDSLINLIPSDQIDQLNRGFEVIGDIAIIEIPDESVNLSKTIAWTLKRLRNNIKIVARKGKRVSGKYRLRKSTIIVGENRTETLHKESNVRIKTDINKAYFSARMGAERLRLSKQVKNKENILVMFSGVGPYGLILAKQHPSVKVTMVDLNPAAIRYAKENVLLNKLQKQITIIKGDAKIEVPKLTEKFDRIIMVLPSIAHEFLNEALNVAKKKAKIHLYQFANEDSVGERVKEVKQIVEKCGSSVKSIKAIKSGYYSPKINRYSFDIQLA